MDDDDDDRSAGGFGGPDGARSDGRPNPLVAQLAHAPFPEVAAALRAEVGRITGDWCDAVREAMPQMRRLSEDDLADSTPVILRAIADALASADPGEIRELVRRAPAQGLSRLALDFDVIEVMQEDRLLRAVVVLRVEASLGRRMDVPESAALHAAVDLMLQRSVIALVDEQKVRLRAAAEAELKFLSFLSHDLNGHLSGVGMWLGVLGRNLKREGGHPDSVEALVDARRAIDDTLGGTRRMLDHERLRRSDDRPVLAAVDLHAVAKQVAGQFPRKAGRAGPRLAVEVLPGTTARTERELLVLVLQNLVGNAVKYSAGGTVRVGADGGAGDGGAVVWVSDEGPGIAAAKVGLIFEAFRRGDVHGQAGVGLGLAIASQAARLLGADLTVESQLGLGSTFRLALPSPAAAAAGAGRRRPAEDGVA